MQLSVLLEVLPALQVPVTSAPDTGLPLLSRTVIVTNARHCVVDSMAFVQSKSATCIVDKVAVIAVPVLSPSGSWFMLERYPKPDLVILPTVKVALGAVDLLKPVLVTVHVPKFGPAVEEVVQVVVPPDPPPTQLPVMAAPGTKLCEASCTVILTVALQAVVLVLVVVTSRSPTCMLGTIVSVSVALLLAGFGSITPTVVPVTEALLLNVPVAVGETVAVTVKTTLPPAGRLTNALILPLSPRGQLAPFAGAQVQLTLVRFAGKVSVTVAVV